MRLRVEYRYDPESKNWNFRVPSLGIVGGAVTHDEAERKVVEAIAFTLESDDEGHGRSGPAEVTYLNLEIAG
jgi:hypothetical protein